MKKHFVTFYSPGTFVAETTSQPIESWDIEQARSMMNDVVERYGAKPYGFCFTTREQGDDDLDSKETARSPLYYVGGIVESLAEVEARNDPDEQILRNNMRINGWERIWISTSGWKWTRPLEIDDVVLPA